MRRLIPLLLVLPALGAEPLTLEAELAEDRTEIRVRVEGAFPARAIVTVEVLGDAQDDRKPYLVKGLGVPAAAAGLVEARIPLAERFRPLGAFRVRAFLHPERQYPAVREALGASTPAPAERRLTGNLASEGRLREIVGEEAFVLDLLDETGRFLEQSGELERARDLERWKAWREGAIQSLSAGTRRGRVDKNLLFPTVNASFSYLFVRDILLAENERYCIAAGVPIKRSPGLLGGRRDFGRKDLEPFLETLGKESFAARLEALKAVEAQVRAEMDLQERSPDPARWEKRREAWDAWLALWASNLDRLPRGKELAGMGKALASCYTSGP